MEIETTIEREQTRWQLNDGSGLVHGAWGHVPGHDHDKADAAAVAWIQKNMPLTDPSGFARRRSHGTFRPLSAEEKAERIRLEADALESAANGDN